MNRAEKRRQQKHAKKAAPKVQGEQASSLTQKPVLAILESLNLAVTYVNAGRLPEAERLCREVLQTDPTQHHAWHLLGLIATQVGKYDVAVNLISKAIAISPDFSDAYYNLGNAFKGLNKLDEAKENYQKVLALKPDDLEALYSLGIILNEQGFPEEAAASYGKALALKPDYAEAHNNLGVTLLQLKKWDEAIASYKRALDASPDYAEAHNNLGIALRVQERVEEAAASFKNAIALDPGYAEALSNLGMTLLQLSKLEEAVASIQKAIEANPDDADAHNNLGIVRKEQGHRDEAAACYRKALSIKPDHAKAHWNLAAYYLEQQDLTKGWQEYEWGLKPGGVRSQAQSLTVPVWNGEPIQGKDILVYAEQGVGDEVLFSTCIPDLVARSPKGLFLECDPRLQPLFARSFPTVVVCGKNRGQSLLPMETDAPLDVQGLSWIGNTASLDYALPIGSLPKFFRSQPEDFPRRDAVLFADPEKQGALRTRYTQRWPQKRLVGLSWRSTNKGTGPDRSLSLECLAPILSHQDYQFINLQYGDVEQEISDFKAQTGIDIFLDDEIDSLADLDGFAAQIAALDLVITIDNSTAHIAGALGVPTWALLPTNANWRWCLESAGNSLWYSCVKTYRQQRRGDWCGVIEQVSGDL